MSAKAYRDAAALLLAEADKIDGKSPGTFFGVDLSDPRAAWASLLSQYAAEDAAREAVARSYDTHKYVWEAAQRERWPSNLGGSYWSGNYKTAKAFNDSIIALMQTDEYKRWAADPLNVNQVPKVPPTV